MLQTKAFAAAAAESPLGPFQIERREPGAHDVLLDVLYCGVCHTDIHQTRGWFPGSIFPMVPGHEVVGRVAKVGSAVSRHRPGDVVGVGCFVDTCRTCPDCKAGEEQFCDRMVPTYNGYERDGKTPTYGGYSARMTVDEAYVLKVGSNLAPAGVAPMLCAGITAYSPLRHWKVGRGSRIAVVGLGGVGHMAVKLAAAMGADVTVLSTSAAKESDAKRLGAQGFAVSKDPATFTQLAGTFDMILSTISAPVDYDAYVSLLRRDGVLLLLGLQEAPVAINTFGLMVKRKSVASSPIGGIRETQEMLDFCAERGITADIELIRIDQVNDAYERMLRSDVRYRFVIDMASLR